ncbi:MFS transporter [Streptomyces diastatochromogenes]|uniref:MFS transporter n=1 Tax=Streptomyces diastatochromogenes TaxID=42236 RepID=UPI0036B65D46
MSNTSATPPQVAARSAERRLTMALIVIVTCQLMIMLDLTIVNTALPTIQRELGFSSANLTWVINAYAVAFGGLLLFGGRLGDVYGRRTVLIVGVAVFTIASLVGGLAQNPTWLLTTRVIQGIGAAVAAPSALSLIATTFTAPPARARALSYYTAASSAGGSLGLLAGGMLTSWVNWRWVMLVNVPIGILIIAFATRFIPQPPHVKGKLDVFGAITGTAGLIGIVYGFTHAADGGWSSTQTIASFVVGAVLLIVFLIGEQRVAQPIIPLALFASRNRAVAYAGMLMLPAAMFASLYFLMVYAQDSLRYTPVEAGFAVVPLTLGVLSSRWTFPPLVKKFGPKSLVVAASALIIIGLVWLSQMTPSTGYGFIVVPTIFCGVGVGIAFTGLNFTVLAGLPPQNAGAAAGMLQTMQQVGGALGIAVLGTIYISRLDDAVKTGTTPQGAVAKAVGDALGDGAVFIAVLLLLGLFGLVKMAPAPAAAPAPAPAPAPGTQPPGQATSA